MSILLEALRKSEKGRHTREVPTIYSDHHSGPVYESLRTGPLALLLVATLFITGWFVWRQYQPQIVDTPVPATSAEPAAVNTQVITASAALPAADIQEPAGSTQPPVVVPALPDNGATPSTVESSSTEFSNSELATAVAGNASAVTTPAVGVETASAASTAADSPARQERTPMESYQPPTDSVAPSKSAGVEPSGATVPPAQASDSGTGMPVEPVTEKHTPVEPAPISYWELPDAVRADLPEIKFSVLVYANKPADRFVLINGERLREGDSPQAGLTLKEIRREGVVFSYQLYQFMIEK